MRAVTVIQNVGAAVFAGSSCAILWMMIARHTIAGLGWAISGMFVSYGLLMLSLWLRREGVELEKVAAEQRLWERGGVLRMWRWARGWVAERYLRPHPE